MCPKPEGRDILLLVPRVLEEMVLTPVGVKMWNPALQLSLRSQLILLAGQGGWHCSWHGEPQHNNAGGIRRDEEFSLLKGRKGCKKRNKQKRANLGVVSGYKPGQKEKFNLLA